MQEASTQLAKQRTRPPVLARARLAREAPCAARGKANGKTAAVRRCKSNGARPAVLLDTHSSSAIALKLGHASIASNGREQRA